MFNENESLIKYHINKIDMALEQLFKAQLDLIKAYKLQWAEMNYLIENGFWNEKAIYLSNAYGLKADKEVFVFQLNAPLPFLPNPYYMRFKESKDEFIAAKLLINLQLRDVINQLEPKTMSQPAALMIKHYYSDVKIFDMDNKAKQVLINTFREKLIVDDNVRSFSYYSEEAIQDEDNRTMLYIGPVSEKRFIEDEIVSQYKRIDHLSEAVSGKHPEKFFPSCPRSEDILKEFDCCESSNKEDIFKKILNTNKPFM